MLERGLLGSECKGWGRSVVGRRNWVGARTRCGIEKACEAGASVGWHRSGGLGRVRVGLGGSLGRSEWEMRGKIHLPQGRSGDIWVWCMQGNAVSQCGVGGDVAGLGSQWGRGRGGFRAGAEQRCRVSLREHGSPRHVGAVWAAQPPKGGPPLSLSVPSCSVLLAVWEGVLEMQSEMAAGLLTERGARLQGERARQRSRALGHTRRSVQGTAAWLCWAGPGLARQLVVTKAWLGFHGLGLVLVFRLETARLG